ncbi:transglycosylase family protein [Streptomyces syringium]|uniref:transglycosylase family protein n=1 Tax=Streptomyces syringium TaxID=76729 RepID=UPI0036B670D0
MRSGNGRHRRPRQVPAIVVAAGVTGASLAMPLLAATGANAAEAETWDKVARCESGGVWSSNAGNGFFGGLQMTQEMWQQNGGTDYAPRPDLASRSQQIAVAEKILASRGPDAWPSCAVSSGLAKGGKAPEVNPGSTHTPEPEAPAKPAPTRNTPSTPSTSSPDSSETEKPSEPSSSPSPSSPSSPDSSPSPSAPTGTDEPTGKPTEPVPGDSARPTDGSTEGGKHRKPSTDDPTEIPSTTPGTPGTDTGSSGTPTPDGTEGADGANGSDGSGNEHAGTPRSDDGRASRDGGTRTDQPGAGDYTVRPGDNLSAIAEQHAVEGGWSSLYQDNKKVVGADPDLIQPGQKLEVKKKAGK